MNYLRNISLMRALQVSILLCAALLAVFGLTVLLGWLLGLPYLSSLGAGYVPVAPSTAALFILYAVAVFLRARTASRAAHIAGLAISLTGGLVAAVLFVLSYQGIYLDIEHIGFANAYDPGNIPLGHISPVSAACFVIASLSYLLLITSSEESWRANIAWGLACLLAVTGVLLLLAYLFGAPLLYGSSFIPPAALTSTAFIVLGVALMGLSAPLTWLARYKDDSSMRTVSVYVLVFILLAAGITAVGYASYHNFETQFHVHADDQLSAVAELKASELNYWRRERLTDADLIYGNATFSNLTARYVNDWQDDAARAEISGWLREYEAFDEYDRVRLVNIRGVTLLSVPDGLPLLGPAVLQAIPEALQTKQITLVDFYRDEQDQRIYLSTLIPILDEGNSSRVIGFVTLRIDPDAHLYPYINQWPIESDSAETLLVRTNGNDVLFLNKIRFNPDAALTLRIPLTQVKTPAVKAALGVTEVEAGADYRGIAVLADTRPVPGSPWYLVTKMDIDEIYAPLRERLTQTFGTILMALFVLGAGLVAVWRQQRLSYYRAQAESIEALRASEERFRAMVENSGDALTLIGADGKVAYEGPTVQRLTGYLPEDRVGGNGLDNVYPEDLNLVRTVFGRVMSIPGSSGSAQFRSVRKDGTIWWAEGTATNMLGNPAVRAIVVNYRDITERKQAEEALRRHLSELKVLYDNGLATSALWEPREIGAKIIETLASDLAWHHIAIRLRRGESDDLELIAFSQSDLNVQDAAKVEERLNTLVSKIGEGLSGWSVQIGRAIRTGNVQEHPQYVDTYSGIRSGMYAPLMVGERAVGCIAVESEEENAFTEQDERLLATLAAQTAIAFENARLYLNVQQELQERMRAEEKILQLNATLEQRVEERTQELRDAHERLVRQERLATLGQLSGSVAHELRNPLGVISNAIYFLKMALPDVPDKIKEYLNIIENETRTSDKIVTELLDFTRIKSMERKAVSISDLIQRTLERYPAPESIQVTLDLSDELPQVYADPQHVVQVLGNITLNAFQAMPKGGKLSVASKQLLALSPVEGSVPSNQSRVLSRDEGSVGSDPPSGTSQSSPSLITDHRSPITDPLTTDTSTALSTGHWILITVKDTGHGITPENIKKIFEPLFSTKTTGIGLGLAVSQKLIEANGGRIEVESEVGVGSTFSVYLPQYVAARNSLP